MFYFVTDESTTTPINITPAKPILKLTEKETSVPRKSVRFSLRPGNITTPKSTETELITPDDANEQVDEDHNIAEVDEVMIKSEVQYQVLSLCH